MESIAFRSSSAIGSRRDHFGRGPDGLAYPSNLGGEYPATVHRYNRNSLERTPARTLLADALERTSRPTRWWKPSTWRRFERRSGPASLTGLTPREAFELILAITTLARRSLHERRT